VISGARSAYPCSPRDQETREKSRLQSPLHSPCVPHTHQKHCRLSALQSDSFQTHAHYMKTSSHFRGCPSMSSTQGHSSALDSLENDGVQSNIQLHHVNSFWCAADTSKVFFRRHTQLCWMGLTRAYPGHYAVRLFIWCVQSNMHILEHQCLCLHPNHTSTHNALDSL
jgi:hypothetical protein